MLFGIIKGVLRPRGSIYLYKFLPENKIWLKFGLNFGLRYKNNPVYIEIYRALKIILPKLTFWGDIIPLKWSKKWPKINLVNTKG